MTRVEAICLCATGSNDSLVGRPVCGQVLPSAHQMVWSLENNQSQSALVKQLPLTVGQGDVQWALKDLPDNLHARIAVFG